MADGILGLGCDILEVHRIQSLLEKGGEAFVGRVLTPAELVQYNLRKMKSPERGVLFVATRFCVKEAFAKAMGTGVGQHFSFQDLSVLNDDTGAPAPVFSEKLENWLSLRQAAAKLSISDEQNYVMSTVILYLKQ